MSGSKCAAFFQAIAAKLIGEYIIRLRKERSMDHEFMMDANRGVIVDSEQSLCLSLREDVLVRCTGTDANRLEICQVLRIGSTKELDQVEI